MTNTVRLAGLDDAAAAGRLLYDFNREFDEPTPAPSALAERIRQLLEGGDTLVLLAGDGPDGLAVLRFRAAIWSTGQECYLAELYVAPASRGQGLGRALMEAALREARDRGADTMDIGVDEPDLAARQSVREPRLHQPGGRRRRSRDVRLRTRAVSRAIRAELAGRGVRGCLAAVGASPAGWRGRAPWGPVAGVLAAWSTAASRPSGPGPGERRAWGQLAARGGAGGGAGVRRGWWGRGAPRLWPVRGRSWCTAGWRGRRSAGSR